MNRKRLIIPYVSFFLVLLNVFLLVGCTGKTEKSYPLDEKRQAFSVQIAGSSLLAEPFGQDLCIIADEDPAPDSSVDAAAAAVFSLADRQVLLQKNAMERLYPASMTKIMTALVALRYGELNQLVTVGQEVEDLETGSSLCHIHPGDTLTLEQLLYGLMLPSGNDAGMAIAVHIGGSVENFSDMMNRTALELGATDTHFTNPHGLHDEDHYTTAYDLYLIFQEALKDPVFRSVIGTASFDARYTDAQGEICSRTWVNTNQYISGEASVPDGITVTGGKTGTTNAAGSCLIMGSMDDDQNEYVSIIMKSGSRASLYDSMTNIIQKIVN